MSFTRAIMKCINDTVRSSMQYRGVRMAAYGLTGVQCSYIIHIRKNPGVTQDQLARELFVNRSNVTRQLEALETAGFVTRRASLADKRVVEVFPTDKALSVYPDLERVLADWRAYITQDLTDAEAELFSEFLAKVRARAVDYERGLLGKGGDEA